MPRRASSKSHPFLFYGARPGDWFEGANCGHCYAVRFTQRPAPAQRPAIAESFEAELASSSVDTRCKAMRWKEDWLILYVGEAHTGGRSGQFFEDMEKGLLAMHNAVEGGIAVAVFLGQREPGSSDRWTRWSEQQAKRPTPPEWESGQVDATCEAARERVREEATDRKQEKASKARVGNGEVALVKTTVAVNAKSERGLALSPDGKRRLVGVKSIVREVDLDSGETRDLLDLRTPVRGVAWLEPNLIAAVTDAETFLVDISNREQAVFLRQESFDGTGMFSVLGGSVLGIVRSDRPNPVVLFARKGDRLYRFASLKPEVSQVFEQDGRVYATGVRGTFELVNLEASRDRALQAPPELEEIGYLLHDDDPVFED